MAKSTPTPLADWTMPFLKMLAHTGNVLMASKAAGVSRVMAYRVRNQRADFRKLWDSALEDAILELEEIARKRAVETSDTLLIFLLKAHRPEKYRENIRHEVTGPEGGAIRITAVDYRTAVAPLLTPGE